MTEILSKLAFSVKVRGKHYFEIAAFTFMNRARRNDFYTFYRFPTFPNGLSEM